MKNKQVKRKYKTSAKHRKAQKKYRLGLQKKHPILWRKSNATAAAKYRNNHSGAWSAYYCNYFQNWLKNPVNFRCHRARNIPIQIRHSIKIGGPYKESTILMLENLTKVGWSSGMSKELVVNHKVSLWHLFTFNIELPLPIVFNWRNIEIIPRKKNSSRSKRVVTRDTIRVAKRLEKAYPIDLKGFSKWLSKRKGEFK